MEHTRKMILVPEECIKELKNNQQQVVSKTVQTPGSPTSRLDEEMNHILNSSDVKDTSEKWLLYENALQRYLHYKNSGDQTPSINIPHTSQALPTVGKKERNYDSDIIEALPSKFRLNAQRLLHRLRDDGAVKWNERGQITLDGIEVRGVNIVDLVNEAMRARKGPPPRGYSQYANILRKAAVPREFVGNKELWKTVLDLSIASAPVANVSELENSATETELEQNRSSSPEEEEEEEDNPAINQSYRNYVEDTQEKKKKKRKRNSQAENETVLSTSVAPKEPKKPRVTLKPSILQQSMEYERLS